MSENHQVAEEPMFKTPVDRVWIKITNICDPGMFKVTLEVNGVDRDLFYSYPDRHDGLVSESHNLTWLLNERNQLREDNKKLLDIVNETGRQLVWQLEGPYGSPPSTLDSGEHILQMIRNFFDKKGKP